MMRALTIATALLALAGCGEKSQVQGEGRNAHDTHAYQGAKGPFVAKGWTAGDKASWENQIRARGQYQNEYGKTN